MNTKPTLLICFGVGKKSERKEKDREERDLSVKSNRNVNHKASSISELCTTDKDSRI
jgi:hypothetical protein